MTENSPSLFGQINWKWMLVIGILLILLGVAGLGMTFSLTMASAMVFGIFLLVGGALQIINAFQCKGWKGIIWHILIGLLYLAAGVVTLRNPAAASALFTAMLAGAFIAIGISRIFLALMSRKADGWFWLLLAGIAALTLGIMLLAKWPVSGLFAIGMFIAIDLIMQGWSLVVLALAARKLKATAA